MKKHIFSMAMASVVVLAFIGCEDLVKDDIDAKYNRDVTVSAPECADVNYVSATISYTIDGDTAGLAAKYCGVLVSETEDFSDIVECNIKPGEEKNIWLFENTNYFAKSYFVVGTEIRYGGVTQFKTTQASEFKDKFLLGTYTAYDDGNVGDPNSAYGMEITQIEGSNNRIEITNWWDGGETVTARVDFENKLIIVDDDPAIFNYGEYLGDPSLGFIYFYDFDEDDNFTNVIGEYDDEGNISFPYYFIYLDGYGEYGEGCTDMIKD